MNTKQKVIGAVVVVVLMGGSFWGGMAYAKSKTPARGQFANMQFGAGAAGARGGFARGAGMGGSAGQVVSVSDSSMTIKLASGSTQIVLLGTSTQVTKSAMGTIADLTAGTNVIITGSSNSDGSITAQSVQIRPTPVRTQQ
jgi:hypothetical protein